MGISIGVVEGLIRFRDEGTSQINAFAAVVEKHGKRMQVVGRQMSEVGGQLTTAITLPILALGGLATKAATDFESSFAGVRKTVDATEEEFAALATGMRSMAKEIPVNVNELNAIGEAAGQLGIRTTAILGFTRVVADLGVTTNLSSDAAATSLARLANITGLPQEQFDRLGSTIVALGNTFATTEAEIVEFGLRMAGAGTIAGLTEAEILGIGAAMSSVGVEAEAGGTAVQKVLLGMTQAVAQGNADLAIFASTAGLSAREFAAAWRADAGAAFTAFVEGLGRQGEDAFVTLEKLNLQDQRLIRSFLSLAGAGDLLARTMVEGNTAFAENNALAREAEQRYNTFSSKLRIFLNELRDVAITFGTALLPVFRDMLTIARPVVSVLASAAEAFARLPQPVRAAAVALAGILAAVGPVLFIAGQLVTAYGAVIAMFPKVAAVFALASKGIAAAAAALTGPAGWIAAGVALLLMIRPVREAVFDLGGRALGALRDGISAVVAKLREWWEESAEVRRVLGMVARQLVADLGTALRAVGDALQVAWEWTERVARAMADAFVRGMEMLGILRALKGAWDAVADATKRAVEWLEKASGLAGKEGLAKFLAVLMMINPALAQAAAGAAAYTARAVELQSRQQGLVKVASEVASETENIVLTTQEMDRAFRKAAAGGGGVAALSEEVQKLADRWRLAIEQSGQLVAAIEQGGRPAFEGLQRQIEAVNEVAAAGVKPTSDLGRELVALGVKAAAAEDKLSVAVDAMNERLRELIENVKEVGALDVALSVEAGRIARIQQEVDFILDKQSMQRTLKDIDRALTKSTEETSDDFRKRWVETWLAAAKKRKEIEDEAAAHARQVNVNLTNDMLSIWGSALQQLASDAADTADIMEQVFKQMLVSVGTAMAGPIGGIIGGILGSVIFKPSNNFDSASSLGGNWRNFFGADFAGLQADMERALDAILAVIDGFVEQLPEVAITVSEQGDRFRLQIAGVFVGVFDSFEEALHVGLREALEGAVLVGVAPEILTALANSTARSLEEMVAQLELAQHIADLRVGAGELAAELRVLYREFLANADAARRLGLETAGLTGEFIGRLRDIRDDILGITRDEFDQRKQDADDFNRFIQAELEKAAAELDRLLGAYARYQQVAELIGRGQRILAEFGFKTAEEMLARILELQNLLASLPDLLIDPATIPRGRGRGGPSPRQQDMEAVRDLLDAAARQLLPEFARAMAEINLKWDEAIEKAHGNADLIAEITAARQAEIEALREQRLLSFTDELSDFLSGGGSGSSFVDAINGVRERVAVLGADLGQLAKDLGLTAHEMLYFWQAVLAGQREMERKLATEGFIGLVRGLADLTQSEQLRHDLLMQAAQLEFDLRMAQYQMEFDMLQALGYLTAEQIALIDETLGNLAANRAAIIRGIVPVPGGGAGGGGGGPDPADERARALARLRDIQARLLSPFEQAIRGVVDEFAELRRVLGWTSEVQAAYAAEIQRVLMEQLEPIRRMQEELAFRSDSPMRSIDQFRLAQRQVIEAQAALRAGDLSQLEAIPDLVNRVLELNPASQASEATRFLFEWARRALDEAAAAAEAAVSGIVPGTASDPWTWLRDTPTAGDEMIARAIRDVGIDLAAGLDDVETSVDVGTGDVAARLPPDWSLVTVRAIEPPAGSGGGTTRASAAASESREIEALQRLREIAASNQSIYDAVRAGGVGIRAAVG